MKKISPTLVLLLLISMSATAAVSISPNNRGQAIIVPYYTVANGLNTALSINNAQDHPKAVKVNIREGRQSAAVYTFNVYLAANDIWTMAMYEEESLLKIATEDTTCVLNFPNTENQVPIIDESLDWDSQTGSIEVIEMASISNESQTFFSDLSDEENCLTISDAWYPRSGPSGLWNIDPTDGLIAASGGLTADVKVIDVLNGFAFSVPTTALKNFYSAGTIFHTEPESSLPDLSSGTKNSILVFAEQFIETTWPTGYEAVSALLMRTTLGNEYDVTPGIGAVNEWVLSFPTLRFHKNNPESQTPFIFENTDFFRFPGIQSDAYTFYDRDGKESREITSCVTTPSGSYCPSISYLKHPVNTYVINPWGSHTPDSAISGSSNDRIMPLNLWGSTHESSSFLSGKVELNILTYESEYGPVQTSSRGNHRGMGSAEGLPHQHIYNGLPVIGFAFQKYQNANAQPGILATYANAKPHYGKRFICCFNGYEPAD